MRTARVSVAGRVVRARVDGEALVLEGGDGSPARPERVAMEAARLLTPVDPAVIVAPGPLVRGGRLEAHREFYLKSAHTALRPRGSVPYAPELGTLSYRAQLGVMLRPTERWTPAATILDGLAGIVLAADVMSVDRLAVGWEGTMWHVRYGEGGSFDGACPLGPWLVTPETAAPGDVELADAWGAWRVDPAAVADFLAYVNRWIALAPDVLVLAGSAHGPELLEEGGEPRVDFGAREPRLGAGARIWASGGPLGEIDVPLAAPEASRVVGRGGH